jgi:hypothetical protein
MLGHTFNILSLDKLVVAKRTAGRPKDLAMLPELEAILEYERVTGVLPGEERTSDDTNG